jgi:nicotinamidase-related amidase/alkylated DNA repair dioxygenase AlkB
LVVLGPDAANKRSLSETSTDTANVEPQGPVDEEAFLSSETSKCCRPHTPGAQFPAPILAAIDAESDTLIDKTDYSALQSQGLILSLRTRFVTELYLCGSLCNASVYATALDAVRHGFSVTLIEDCLGFRSFARHEEAMRRMADIFGANGITTEELYEELDWQETDAIARKGSPRPVRNATPSGIEAVMDDLFKPARATRAPRSEEPETSERGNLPAGFDAGLGENPIDEHDDILASVARTRRSREVAQAQKQRVKARRTQRMDSKAESTSRTESRRSTKSKPSRDIRKPGDAIGEGDSRIIYDLDLPSNAFEEIRKEVAWQKMYHMSGEVPRLVAVQGQPWSDGSIPIYRHPADKSPPLQPFTATIDRVRMIVERILRHPVNHVLIQLYRDGQDSISEHSDKTLDIVRGSSICNVSLGAQRVMVLRGKSKEVEKGESSRPTQRVPMPHESLFILGEKTNRRWLHGIRPDKRAVSEKSMDERAYGGARISLTFRHIGTFLNPAGDTIWGQGAVSKIQDQANPVIHGDPAETERLIRAFGEENHAIDFDWDTVYGGGFDVVNFVTVSTTTLVRCLDEVANLRALICLSESGVRYTLESPDGEKRTEQPLYIDADGTEIAGDINILNHLAQRSVESTRPGVESLDGGDKLAEIDELLEIWREYQKEGKEGRLECLNKWERALIGRSYLNGATFGLDDCSLWPVLREIVQTRGPFSAKTYHNLAQYYKRVENRGFVKRTLEELR